MRVPCGLAGWYGGPARGACMIVAVFIFVDDEFDRPIYADPDPDELDPDLWHQVCETVNDAIDGDGGPAGVRVFDGSAIVWRTLVKVGVSFVTVAPDTTSKKQLDRYLRDLSSRYVDEVSSLRKPDRAGVADVVVDVIPDWYEDDD
ncbi:MAG: hypothetical protein ACI8PZ_000675 [Myxococcota bacterium]|jgi:hypothetical protein